MNKSTWIPWATTLGALGLVAFFLVQSQRMVTSLRELESVRKSLQPILRQADEIQGPLRNYEERFRSQPPAAFDELLNAYWTGAFPSRAKPESALLGNGWTRWTVKMELMDTPPKVFQQFLQKVESVPASWRLVGVDVETLAGGGLKGPVSFGVVVPADVEWTP